MLKRVGILLVISSLGKTSALKNILRSYTGSTGYNFKSFFNRNSVLMKTSLKRRVGDTNAMSTFTGQANYDSEVAKRSKLTDTAESVFLLGRNRRLSVESFKGVVRIDIREYYDADGELKPGKKGISLRANIWNTLKDKISDINSCIAENKSRLVDLENLLKVSVSYYQDQQLIQIREYQVDEQSQEQRPGSKGISLSPAEWEFLCDHVDKIDAAIERYPLRERSTPLAPTDIVTLGSFSLGKLKNVSVSQVKGKTIVDIREFYLDEATQTEKPGKKGIALSVSQWAALSEVKEKLAESQTDAVYLLGDMRKASYSFFKDQAFINIREYYVDKTSDEEKPGAKGIALNLAQWTALQEHWAEIDALLGIFPEPAVA